ncbi:PQQ-binding-like beta-propeller repeat protein [Actinoplanes sp. NPDC051494]|uniref:outer membrane protein assembly factor BamB family protein n=1 Tax=Actinoplanes sp. NPDC051494 TaxID=3363907 RepID=UPI00379ECBE1
MPDAVPLIDLDDRSLPDPVRRGRPPLRPWLVVGVLVAAMVTLGAAAPPPPGMREVLTISGAPVTGFVVGVDALYTTTFSSKTGKTEVNRYALGGGGAGWTAGITEFASNLRLDPTGGILMARDNSGERLAFLDAADGTVLWRHLAPEAGAVLMTAGGVLLPPGADGALVYADIRTGTPIWRRVVGAEVDVRSDEEADRVVVTGLDGRVTVLRLTDGSVLGQGDLGVTRASDTFDVLVDVTGDRLIVSDEKARTRTAYRLPGVTRDWQVRDTSFSYAQLCGTVYCLSPATDGVQGVSGVDPADGSELWSLPGWDYVRMLADGRTTVLAGREIPVIAEIDPRDGSVLRERTTGALIGEVTMHPDAEALGRTWVLIADRHGTGRRALGPFAIGAYQTCGMIAPYLACQLTTGPLTVWRLPGE